MTARRASVLSGGARHRQVWVALGVCAWIGAGVPLGFSAGWLSGLNGQPLAAALTQAACVTMSLGAGLGAWQARAAQRGVVSGARDGVGDGVTLGMPFIVGWLLACCDLAPVWAQARKQWMVVLPVWALVCGLGLFACKSVRADYARTDETKDDVK